MHTDNGASVPDRAGGPADPSPAVSAKGAHPSRGDPLLNSPRKASCRICGDQDGLPRDDGLASFCLTCGKMREALEGLPDELDEAFAFVFNAAADRIDELRLALFEACDIIREAEKNTSFESADGPFGDSAEVRLRKIAEGRS